MRAWGRAVIAASIWMISSCGGCALAELVEFDGRADRDFARAPEQWQPASRGAAFRMGDAVRTRESSRAELKLSGGGVLRLSASTAVRFVSEAPGAADVRVESGDAEIEAGEGPVNVFTDSGRARVAVGGRLQIHRDGSGQTRFSVVFGSAVIEDEAGPSALATGGSLILPRRPTPPPSPPPSAVLTATVAARTSSGSAIRPGDEGPAVPLEAGRDLVLHGAIPLALRLPDACGGKGSVILRGGGDAELLRKAGERVLRFVPPLGAQRYEILCADGRIIPGGAIERSADEGKRRRVETLVVTDGQPKTILKEPRQPPLTFRWPRAPSADAYSLVLERAGAKEPERIAIERPEHAAQLPEGKYRVWFEVAESDQRSPPTELWVRAGSGGPEIGELIARGKRLILEGRVAPGTKVWVEESELLPGPDGRFAAQLEPAGPATVLVRVDDPKLGLHVYARRRPGADARSGP